MFPAPRLLARPALPDGTTQRGVPGADGGCAAIWESAQPPSWVRPVPVSAGLSVAWLSADPSGQVTVTVREGDRDGRYVVVCARPGTKEVAVAALNLQTMLHDGLAAVDGD